VRILAARARAAQSARGDIRSPVGKAANMAKGQISKNKTNKTKLSTKEKQAKKKEKAAKR
jgi:hypothetical protein